MKHVLCMLCSVSTSHLWTQDNHAIHKHGYEASIWAGIIGDIVGLSAARQADCLVVSWFSSNCSTGAAWKCALTCKAEVVYDRAPAHCWECVWQWLNMTYPGRWILCVGLGACPPCLPDQTSMGFCYGSTRSNMFVQSLAGPSSSCDCCWCHHVEACLMECCVVHGYMPWNRWRPLQTPVVITRHPCFDHLIACNIWWNCVSCKLNMTGHVLCNILNLLFNKEWCYGKLVHTFCFPLCIWMDVCIYVWHCALFLGPLYW
jgi:hypothetical protein